MAARHRVTCITKRPSHYDPHERIQAIGGASGGEGGGPWKINEDAAIQGIESGKWQFYVLENGHQTNVIVASRNGRKYLKTESDHYLYDNLLALPECP